MEAEKFLKNEIPYNIRQKLIGTFSRAYADTENLKISDVSDNVGIASPDEDSNVKKNVIIPEEKK